MNPQTYDPSLDAPPAHITGAANLIDAFMRERGAEPWCLGGVASRKYADDPATISLTYGEMIRATVERTCLKRIEEIEGRVPSREEIAQHGEMQLTPESGIVTYLWKNQVICEYVPAGYTLDGRRWRDATISEFRPRILS